MFEGRRKKKSCTQEREKVEKGGRRALGWHGREGRKKTAWLREWCLSKGGGEEREKRDYSFAARIQHFWARRRERESFPFPLSPPMIFFPFSFTGGEYLLPPFSFLFSFSRSLQTMAFAERGWGDEEEKREVGRSEKNIMEKRRNQKGKKREKQECGFCIILLFQFRQKSCFSYRRG